MNNSRYIIGIGAQKSGTSWLGDYFLSHPEVLISPIKELHFFDSLYRPELCAGLERNMIKTFIEVAHKLEMKDVLNNSRRFNRFNKLSNRVRLNGDIQNYRDYFKNYAKNESVFCDITPEYALLTQQGFESIKSLADDVRLIFLIRNPIDRFWSALRMRANKNPAINIMTDFDDFLNKPHFYLSTDYQKTLETVYSVFAKEKVFVEFYEHLFNPDVIAQLCDFCAIEFIEPDTEKRILPGISVPLGLDMRERIYKKFSHVYTWADSEFGEALPELWRADIEAFAK